MRALAGIFRGVHPKTRSTGMDAYEETGDTANPEAEPAASESPTGEQTTGRAEDAWAEVVRSVESLGRAVAAWGGSLKDDPKNRQRAEQLKERLEGVGKDISEAVSGVASSDVAQDIGKAATSAGRAVAGTARRVGDEVSPHIAGAFKSVAEGLREAAERMERGAAAPGTTPEPGPHPSPSPAPYDGSEPPAPAPSGVHEDE
jgi:hypothetical protein